MSRRSETAIIEELSRRGHDTRVWNELDAYGPGQIIWRSPTVAYIAGSDHRGDGQATGN